MKNTYKVLGAGAMLPLGVAAYLAFSPADAEAFYVSQKEQQRAGLKSGQITNESIPVLDRSYTGQAEDGETRKDIGRRVNRGLEKNLTINLSEEETNEILAEFNDFKGIEMPSVRIFCGAQYLARRINKLEKKIEEQRKSGYPERDLASLRDELQEFQKKYDKEISDLIKDYLYHEERIKRLEEEPEQKDYSGEIDDLKRENEEIRGLLEDIENYIRGEEYAPPAEEGGADAPGYSSTTVIHVQPGWFVGVPYGTILLSGYFYYPYWVGTTYLWRPWGWLDFYDGCYCARGFDGGTYYYGGYTTYLPELKHHWDHHKPNGRHWKGKDFHPGDHPRPDPKRWERDIRPSGPPHKVDPRRTDPGREHLGDRGPKPDAKRWKDGRFDSRREKNPSREDSWTNHKLQRKEAPKMHGYPQRQETFHKPLQANPQANQRKVMPPVVRQNRSGFGGGNFTPPQRNLGNLGSRQRGLQPTKPPVIHSQPQNWGAGASGIGPKVNPQANGSRSHMQGHGHRGQGHKGR